MSTVPIDPEVAAFHAAHPGFDLSTADLYDRGTVEALGLPDAGAAVVLEKLRVRQRVQSIAPDAGTAEALIAAGLDSAHRVATMAEHRFVREHAGLFGGDEDAAARAHRKARAVKAAVAHLHADVHATIASPHFAALHGNHVDPALGEYLTAVPSYRELFGGLDHLRVPECASIFGPAAYFTDLMRVTDQYVTGGNTILDGQRLQQRRPDLFELPLTCAATTEVRPTLDIVNAILGRRIAEAGKVDAGTVAAAAATTVTLGASAAATAGAYAGLRVTVTGGTGVGQTRTITAYTAGRVATVDQQWAPAPDTTSTYVVAPDPYLTVATAPYPSLLPWSLPRAQVRSDLEVLRTPLSELLRTFAAPAALGTATAGADRELAGLSAEQYRIVTTPVADGATLAPYFGGTSIDLQALSDVDTFCARSGLDRDRLTALLHQGLSAAERSGGPGRALFINATGEPVDPMTIAGWTRIVNLTQPRLDRLNRFLRLAAALGWDFADLDWALRSVQPGRAVPLIDQDAVAGLAGIVALRRRTGLGITELCAQWTDLRTTGRGDGPAPADQFDRIFNRPALPGGRDPYTSIPSIAFNPDRPVRWDPASFDREHTTVRARLLSSLGVTDDELTELAYWAGPGPLLLDLRMLSRLYRVAAAARMSRSTVGDLLAFDGLTDGTAATPAEVLARLELIDRLRRSGFSVARLRYVLRGVRTAGFRPPYATEDLAPFITALSAAAEGARLGPESFRYTGVDETASARVFAELVAARVVTDLGILLGGTSRHLAAAAQFPLTAAAFVTTDIPQQQAGTVFAELCAADPPVLVPGAAAGTELLSDDFTDRTGLGYLFPGDPAAENKRNQVRAVLLATKQRIEITEFAWLFRVEPEAFVSEQVTAAAADDAFDRLAAQAPALVVPVASAGQARTVTAYDAGTGTATLDGAWGVPPAAGDPYRLTAVAATGAARGGTLTTIVLASDADPADDAYHGMTVHLTRKSNGDAAETATVVAYAGATRTAALGTPWRLPPADGDAYVVTAVAGTGRVRAASATTVQLDPLDPALDPAGLTVTLTRSGRLSATFDPTTPLHFLFPAACAGQQRSIVQYVGATRAAIVGGRWTGVPDATTCYEVVNGRGRVVARGRARGGEEDRLFLALDTEPADGAYDGMTLRLVADPAEALKRGEAGQALSGVLSSITHTAEVVTAAGARQEEYVTQGLAGLLGTTTERLAVVVPAATRAADVTDHLGELLTPIQDGQVPPDVTGFVAALARSLVLVDTLGMDLEQIAAVARLPRAFNVVDPAAPTVPDVAALSVCMDLERRFADSADDLVAYLRRPDDPVTAGTATPGPKLTALADLGGWPVAQVKALVDRFWPPVAAPGTAGWTTVAGVARLADCFDAVQRTGLDTASLLRLAAVADLPAVRGLLDGPWQAWTDAAQLTRDAVEARTGSADEQRAGALREAARDALVGYAVWALGRQSPRIDGPAALYEHLLIDVETAGCAQTSAIAQGIAAVQLYLQRCRLMLEQDNGVTGLTQVPDTWWEWLSSYRVWEANRKVFLYPENYLQPALRRAVTPAFDRLRTVLLERDVTPETAEAALRGYVEDFATIGNLVVVDAYQCRLPAPGPDVVVTSGRILLAYTRRDEVQLENSASEVYNAYQGMTILIGRKNASTQRRRIDSYNGQQRIVWLARGTEFTTAPGVDDTYTVLGPRMIDAMFLVARTNTAPYTYYHRRFDTDGGWGPWRAVDVAITAPVATPVYAFDRLFLYWVELSTAGSSTITSPGGAPTSKAATWTTATVKFAYLDTDGRWSTPQTVGGDRVIDYRVDYVQDPWVPADGFTGGPFQPDQARWRTVTPLYVPARASTSPSAYPNGDQILVNFGGWYDFKNTAKPRPALTPGEKLPPEQAAFRQQICDAIAAYSKIVAGNRDGQLPALPAVTMSATLTRRSTVTPVLVDVAVNNAVLGPVVDRAGNRVCVTATGSGNPLMDNASWSSYPGLTNPISLAGSVPLLGLVDGSRAAVISVKNLVGSFLVDTGDETFLVRAVDPGNRPLSDIVTSSVASGAMPAGFQYLATARYSTTAAPPKLSTFAFTRLSTLAARALPDLLTTDGLPGVLGLDTQRMAELPFGRLAPASQAVAPTTSTVDFQGANGPYLWELFFHGPFLVADALTTARRFADAKRWLEYVYQPTQAPAGDDTGPQRYWRFLPFRSMTLPALTQTLSDPAQINAYNDDPFDPDAIARLRISAYAKATVLRYVGNLLDWADDLFTRDSRESIDEATNLYLFAQNLLGTRPKVVGDFVPPKPASFADIKAAYEHRTLYQGALRSAGMTTAVLDPGADPADGAYTGALLRVTNGSMAGIVVSIAGYDGASRTATLAAPWPGLPDGTPTVEVYRTGVPQFLIRLENSAPVLAAADSPVAYSDTPFNDIGTYFGVPENDRLAAVWDRIADRLFKIRHCMNIAGQVRTLPLFAPPLDPAALVRGRAAGVSAQTVAAQLEPAVPTYRFDTLVQRARVAAATTVQLGSALLNALEKQDAAALTQLRSAHEQTLLGLVTAAKQQAVLQAGHDAEALQAALSSAEYRRGYFADSLTAGLSPGELQGLDQAQRSISVGTIAAAETALVAVAAYLVPQVGSPFAMTFGGQQVGDSLTAVGNALKGVADMHKGKSDLALTRAQFERRAEDWQAEADLAERDIAKITAQLRANEAVQSAAARDLTVHLASVEQSAAVAAFLRDRFTGEQLYAWLAARLSSLHFQTYTLALDLARTAQRAFQYELDRDTTFVNFGYWDGGRRGLLAGEGLLLALGQMEKAYLDQNTRPLHIARTVALSELDPLALQTLTTTGECLFTLPERLFDGDHPGQYARKITSLAVSVPAPDGTYRQLHGTLAQLSNQVIVAPDVNAVEFLLGAAGAQLPAPSVLRSDWRVDQQIAVSTGNGDTGVLDGEPDGRYRPFEGTGVVSTWRLRLPARSNPFLAAVTDVVLQLRYQARDGGQRFRDQVMRLSADRPS